MIDRFREEAGELGANAIILSEVREPTAGERFVGALFGTGADRRGKAIAIYVQDVPSVPEDTQFVASSRKAPSLPPPVASTLAPAPKANASPIATLDPSPAQPPIGALRDVCTVARVIDGDTVECVEGEQVRLRLFDAPEMSQSDFGLKAKILLETILPTGSATTVELDVQERDRYGRVLAYLYTLDGAMVNEKMVRAGYAVVSVYPPNIRYVERIRSVQGAAVEARRGLWASWAFECLPAEHRAGRCE